MFTGTSNMTKRALESLKRFKKEPRRKFDKRYFHKKLPCWRCNKCLMRVSNGRFKGMYVAAIIVEQGFERFVHVACTEDKD